MFSDPRSTHTHTHFTTFSLRSFFFILRVLCLDGECIGGRMAIVDPCIMEKALHQQYNNVLALLERSEEENLASNISTFKTQKTRFWRLCKESIKENGMCRGCMNAVESCKGNCRIHLLEDVSERISQLFPLCELFTSLCISCICLKAFSLCKERVTEFFKWERNLKNSPPQRKPQIPLEICVISPGNFAYAGLFCFLFVKIVLNQVPVKIVDIHKIYSTFTGKYESLPLSRFELEKWVCEDLSLWAFENGNLLCSKQGKAGFFCVVDVASKYEARLRHMESQIRSLKGTVKCLESELRDLKVDEIPEQLLMKQCMEIFSNDIEHQYKQKYDDRKNELADFSNEQVCSLKFFHFLEDWLGARKTKKNKLLQMGAMCISNIALHLYAPYTFFHFQQRNTLQICFQSSQTQIQMKLNQMGVIMSKSHTCKLKKKSIRKSKIYRRYINFSCR